MTRLLLAVLAAFAGCGAADQVVQPVLTGKGDANASVLHFQAELDAAGRSELIVFEVPPNSCSFAIAAEGEQAYRFAVVELTDPTGERLVAEAEPQPRLSASSSSASDLFPFLATSLNRAHLDEGRAALLVPNNPDLAVRPGRWTLRIAGASIDGVEPAAGALRGAIFLRRGPRPTRATLKLHVHVGSNQYESWTAAGAPGDYWIQRTLDETRRLLAPAGIEVMIAGYHQLPPEHCVVASFGGPDNALDRLWAAGQRAEDGVNIFLIDAINYNGRLSAAGIAPVVGGPGTLPGSKLGVAIVFTDNMGRNLAHELGHLLGLYHPAEYNGRHLLGMDSLGQIGPPYDPIADTPTDDSGKGNLMHFQSTARSTAITKGQAWVMLGSPLLD